MNKNIEPRTQYVNDSKVLEHYAIIPTKQIPENDVYNNFSDDEKKIYDEVVKRTMLMFMEDYIYSETKIVLCIENVEFKLTGNVAKEQGWKLLDSENKNSKEKLLPNYKENEKLSLNLVRKS